MHKKTSAPKKHIRSAGIIALFACPLQERMEYIEKSMVSDAEAEQSVETLLRYWNALSKERQSLFLAGIADFSAAREQTDKPLAGKAGSTRAKQA